MLEVRRELSTANLDVTSDGKLISFINPKEILYFPEVDYDGKSKEERVSDADFDLNLKVFDDECLAYLAFRDVFFYKKKWNETALYNSPYQAGVTRMGGYSEMSGRDRNWWKDIRCEYLDYLFRAMQHFGYKQDPYQNLVTLTIGRNGEVILNNGRHRVAAAKLLNVPYVPVLIYVRHVKWWKFKKSIIDYTTRHGGMVYAPLEHIDLHDIPIRQLGRFDEFVKVLSPNTKTIVDLGANWGTMCKKLEYCRRGYICTAVEVDDIEFSFLEKMKFVYKGNYEICHSDICDFIMERNKFDCVLALSIFHHLATTKIGHTRLLQLLRKLDCNEMIFQMPDKGEMDSLTNVFKNYSPDEFCKLIIQNSCLNSYREIGNRQTRKMFHLTK